MGDGPFESVDAIGLPAFAEQIKKEGRSCRRFSKKLWRAAEEFLRVEKGRASVFDFGSDPMKKVEEPAGILILKN